jgi:nucleoside-diphosphate-sugar epimerase
LGERALAEGLSAGEVSFCILRPCNVIGPGSPFISRISDALKSGVMLEVDHGIQNAGLLGVHTLIDCMIWAAESSAAHGQIFNVRDPDNMSWHEFLVRLKAGIKGRGVVLSVPYSVARALGGLLASTHQWIAPSREPLWHPLLTEIFGKSCAHSIARLQSAGAPLRRTSLKESIVDSIQWYVHQ